jgi:hypothetical protein
MEPQMNADKLSAAQPQPKKCKEDTTDFTDNPDKQLRLFVLSVPSVKSVVQSLVVVFQTNLVAVERFEGIAMQIGQSVESIFRPCPFSKVYGMPRSIICVHLRLSAVDFCRE